MARWIDPVYPDRTRACPTETGGLADNSENCGQVTVARVELNGKTWWVCEECLSYIDESYPGDPTAPVVLIRP